MRLDDPNGSKFKRVRTDSPNLAVLTKITTPGEIQATYAYASVGNKPLGETVTAFSLAVSLEAPTVVSIDIKCDFSGNGDMIRPPTKEVLLFATAGNLAKSKKLRDWTSRNAVLIPTFLTEIALTDKETSAEALLKISAERINKQEAENAAEESDTVEEIRTDEESKKRAKTISMKDGTARDATDRIADGFDNILTLLQAVVLKAPQVQAAPLSLRAEKRATGWLCHGEDRNLKCQAPPQQGHTPRSIRTNRIPQWSCNASSEQRGPLICRRGTTESGQGDVRLVPPPSNSSAGNP